MIDPFRQGAHLRHPRVDLLSQQHAAAARLRALADDDFDGIGASHVVGIEPVARRQALVHQHLRRGAFLLRHAAIAGRGGGSRLGGLAAERLLDPGGQRAEAHARDGDRYGEFDGLGGEAGPEHGLGHAALPIALQRIAGQGCREKQQVLEARHAPLRPHAADFVQAAGRGAVNVLDGGAVESRRLFQLQAAHGINTPDWHRHASDKGSLRRPRA